MSIKKHIPNAITCCNLLCGCIAIVQAIEGNLVQAAYLVGLAAIFDFFDGFAARLLRVASPIGKDLDSLADMVTFGVVPGIVAFKLLSTSVTNYNLSDLVSYVPFLMIVFSAIRLAKFNNDIRQTTSFIGLPTPANAILICSLPLITNNNPSLYLINTVIYSPYFLVSLSVLLSYLLVAEIPLFALKFRTFTWAGNRTRYIFLALSVLLLIVFRYVGIPLIILLYILMSLNSNFIASKKIPTAR